MARKRVATSDSDYSAGSSDEYEPQPFEASAGRQRTATSRTKRAESIKKSKSKRAKLDAKGLDEGAEDVETLAAAAGQSHGAAMHVVAEPEPIRVALLQWYEQVHESRGMPWRKPYSPDLTVEERAQRAYEVWISEVMLQQTQVSTVIPYYNKWMTKFPTIRKLAASDIETVNSLWKGLGYYSRAARLLSGARKAVEQFNGRLPDNAKDMETHIPGIGRYSAGAICSIAYNQSVPVLDGNVHRLLSRLLALHAPPKGKQTLDVLWGGATDLVDGCTSPGDLNQALIELGATVCKVRDPQCSACPVQPWCHAYRMQSASDTKAPGTEASDSGGQVGDIEELCALCEPLPAGSPVTSYPMKVVKKKVREELDIVNVIEWRRHADGERWFLLVRRPEGGLLAGLHEFPTAPNVPVTTTSAELIEIPHMLLSGILTVPPPQYAARTSAHQTKKAPSGSEDSSTLRIVKIAPAGDVIHIFSHIKKTYRIQWVVLEGGGADPPCLASLRPYPAGGPTRTKRTIDVGGKKPTKARNAPSKARQPELPPVGTPIQAMWITLDDVMNANIGTGVLKVWNQTRKLWEDVI
ncbi:DNA glycosylase [Daedalea quercina L-15889]|uniref:Adenine DNA glycosylase n=1 Tax=Daedalea quercina L-15889 TaxID=1314783 RepID=A0A165R942_9APHY|nr:DNA glycosylase [Daedalea quercina L-15889]